MLIHQDNDFVVGLPKDTIFVFGSNLAGRHGAGAAKTALEHFGATWNVGEGFSGKSYALPTKDRKIKTLDLVSIKESVDRFLVFASYNPNRKFYLTAVGCGLAGYSTDEIAELFKDRILDNVIYPESFVRYFNEIPLNE